MLKVDLHLHTSEDPYHGYIQYNARELIDNMSELGYDVIAITNHGEVTYDQDLANYAKEKGLLLIPGAELVIEGKEVLVLNIKSADGIKKFSDLEKLKDVLIIAPHPFYPKRRCLRSKLAKNISLFDAVEFCYYSKVMSPFNKKAIKASKKYGKTLMGASDAHALLQLDYTYSLVDSEKEIFSIFDAVKQGKVKVVSRPLGVRNLFRLVANTLK